MSVDITKNAVNMLVDVCHAASYNAGWWTDKDGSHFKKNPLIFSNKLSLIHSEISEALEGDRKNKMDDHLPHRHAREVELADAIIRICDLAGAYEMDLGGALVEKMIYNAQRLDHKLTTRNAEGGKAY